MTQPTWPCGTPKSTNTAFNWRKTPEPPKVLTPRQLHNAKQREYEREKYAKQKALRVNAEASLGSFIPNSVKAPR